MALTKVRAKKSSLLISEARADKSCYIITTIKSETHRRILLWFICCIS